MIYTWHLIFLNTKLLYYLEIPEFQIIVGTELITSFKEDITNPQNVLKDIFYKLMTSEKNVISQNISSHKKNLQSLCK